MTPKECIKAIQRSLREHADFPQRTSFLNHEADIGGSDANVRLPLIEIQTVSQIRIEDFNTDRIGYVRDDNGNRIGRIYHTEYTCRFQIDIWTASKSSYDPDMMGQELRRTLYEHDKAGPDKPFLDESGEEIPDIWNFRILDGGREDDLNTTPSLRRWRQDVELWAYEEFKTTEDYIEEVILPSDEEITTIK